MKRGFCLVLSSFGAGKTASKFHNSLKNSRDRFDSWLTDERIGWRDGQGAPDALSLSDSAIEQRVLSLISSHGDEQAQRDCLIIQQDKSIEDTVREQLIAARLGLGTFRKNCFMLYPAYPVTGTIDERLDPYNGIILAAYIDILYDQGWISYENDGRLLINYELDITFKEQILLPEKIKAYNVSLYCYLEWHRGNLQR